MVSRFIVAVLALVAASAEAFSADITLRFGTINAKTTRAFTEQLIPLKQAIEDGSQGRVAVQLGGLGDFGAPTQLLGMLEKGDLEMISTVQGYHPGRFPLTAVMEMPLLYDNAEQGTYAIWKLYEEGLIAKEYAGFKVLSLYVLPPYGIFTTNADITSLRDLRGLRVRSPSLTVGLAMARLGMIPLGIPNNVVGSTLSDGLIDSISYGWDSGATTPGAGGKMLIEQVKYLVDARFAAPTLMVLMNQKTFDALPADIQKVIDNATGLGFSAKSARMRDGWDNAARERMKNQSSHKVISLSAEQRAEMARRTAPVIEEWTHGVSHDGVDGRKIIERARELVRQSPKA
jgi:TRAP-type C4-dicarboxylate transport system substrate-binding protein